jgi:hypothetical protein
MGAGVVPRDLLRSAVAVVVAAAAMLLWAVPRPAFAAPGESISSYTTSIEIHADGSMRVVETIVYDFGSSERHGIIRRIPARFRFDDTHDRVYPIEDVMVTVDVAPTQVERSSEGGYQILKIGNPDRTLTGQHTFSIYYTVRGALNSFPEHEELYWNTVGNEWGVPIARATATVTAPTDITRAECFAGPAGSRLSCAEKAVTGAQASFAQTGLGNGSGMSVVVALPKGSVANTTPILVERHDLATAFRATPTTIGGGVGLGLLGVAVALFVGWRAGRDRRYVGLLPGLVPERGETAVEERKPLIGKPPVSVEFVPPEKIRPGQVGTLIDEQANVLDVTATILDFAVRRYLHIKELSGGKKQDWELTKLKAPDGLLFYERTLFDALFRERDSVRLSELKNTFATDLAKVRKQLYADMVSQGWYRQSPATTRTAAYGLAIITLIVAVGVTVLLGVFTQAALLGLGLVAGAIALIAVAGKFPARTGRGSAMLERVQGFRLYIATTEAEQIKFQEREQIFSEYLPYAIVFGLADRWAGIFRDIGAVPATGGAATPGLYWYTGAAGWNMANFNDSIGSFTTTTVGTIATTPPSASGSSGFSGGFSGGGGGGGGGGSW